MRSSACSPPWRFREPSTSCCAHIAPRPTWLSTDCHTAQTAYVAEVGQYGDTFERIGFELEGGVAISPTQIDGNYYSFQLQTFDINGNPDANFSVVATADLVPGDNVFDVLMIENNIIVKD